MDDLAGAPILGNLYVLGPPRHVRWSNGVVSCGFPAPSHHFANQLEIAIIVLHVGTYRSYRHDSTRLTPRAPKGAFKICTKTTTLASGVEFLPKLMGFLVVAKFQGVDSWSSHAQPPTVIGIQLPYKNKTRQPSCKILNKVIKTIIWMCAKTAVFLL
jgi:hypothetical protein